MSRASENLKRWRRKTKEKIVLSMGSKCQICGYNKCNDALELHHLIPELKEFDFGKIMANPNSWDKIKTELQKCILLCSNCHKEIHNGIQKIPDSFSHFNEKLINANNKEIDKTYCPVCNKEKSFINKTCSRSCAAKLARKINWDKTDIIKIFEKNNKNYTLTGEELGVSDSSIRKRLKKIKYI